MNKIFIKEDDEVIYEELKKLLQNNGYQITQSNPYDLALLDINLPEESGYEICRKIRLESDVPVIFLTAAETPESELLAFGVGADDYIRKPYNSSVLLARISRLLKRKTTSVYSISGLTLNTLDMTLEYGGKVKELTKNEVRIMYCLMTRLVCSREEIIEDLWDNSLYIDDNTLSVNISRLRDKIKQTGAENFIKTVRGVGYRL